MGPQTTEKDYRAALRIALEHALEARDSIQVALLMNPTERTGAEFETTYADVLRSVVDALEAIENQIDALRKALE